MTEWPATEANRQMTFGGERPSREALYTDSRWSDNVVMSRRTVGTTEFKARCLALLDQVAETGEPLVVTKRGRPVARVIPARQAGRASLRGSVTARGDLVASILDGWEIDR